VGEKIASEDDYYVRLYERLVRWWKGGEANDQCAGVDAQLDAGCR
jgi:hypothetical protein